MTAFSDYYQAFPDPVSLILKLKKMEYDVTNHLLDRQHIKFSPGNGVLAGSDSSEAITAQAVNLSNGAANAQLYLYESSLESLGLEEIINPTKLSDQQSLGLEEIINPTKLSDQQVAAAAFYGPSVGVDLGERLLYPGTKSTGREEIMGCNANHLLYNTPEDGSGIEVPLVKNNATCWKMKNRKADPYIISKSVFEENVPVPLKKSNRDRSKSWATSSASRVREEKSDPELDVIRREPPELQSNSVTKEQKAESRKDYIHVRARRGQATDNHSLAERVRRRKLNDRMNTLQSIVPGCSKISNKALMLEEIINYVQSLQNQVKNLSMKLATISPISTFHHEMTGQFSRDLLPRELRTDAMIAYGTNPYYVDHTPIVAEHPPEGTFV